MVLRVYTVKEMLYLFFAVATPGIADESAAGNAEIGKHFLVDACKFTSLQELKFGINYDIYQ